MAHGNKDREYHCPNFTLTGEGDTLREAEEALNLRIRMLLPNKMVTSVTATFLKSKYVLIAIIDDRPESRG